MKLEFTPVQDWQKFNLLGKRLFDYVNTKPSIATGAYVGNLVNNREIKLDIFPRQITIFSEDALPAVVWIDAFLTNTSRLYDGTVLNDGIKGLTPRKDGFILGNSVFVNDAAINYYYIAIG